MDMPRSCFGLKSDFDFYESFIHKRKRSIRFPAVEFYNSSTITALENQFSSITDFSRTIKCSKLALRVTLLVCGAVKKKHTSGPINGVYGTFSENTLDVASYFSLTTFLLNSPNNNIKSNCFSYVIVYLFLKKKVMIVELLPISLHNLDYTILEVSENSF